jgi:tRNA threonylcarbamoyladenosine biosynthesis protein TsaB
MSTFILCIETSTKACSVALANNGELLAFKESVDLDYSHAEQLNLFIEEVMKQAKIEFGQLNAISVSKGPGSFTGLRIGVSTAKGLAYALNIPLLSLETLESMAVGFSHGHVEESNELLVPMIDARRKEVYLRIFDSELNPKTETAAEVINEDSFNKWKDYKKIHLFGDGADKFDEDFNENERVLVYQNFYPSAQFMTGISDQKFKNKKFEDVAYFEPYYLKEFIAIKPRKLF